MEETFGEDMDDILEDDYYAYPVPYMTDRLDPIMVVEDSREEIARWIVKNSGLSTPVDLRGSLEFDDPPEEVLATMKRVEGVENFKVSIENRAVSLYPENYMLSGVRFELGKLWRCLYKDKYRKTLWCGVTSGWRIEEKMIYPVEECIARISRGASFAAGLSDRMFLLVPSDSFKASNDLQHIFTSGTELSSQSEQ